MDGVCTGRNQRLLVRVCIDCLCGVVYRGDHIRNNYEVSMMVIDNKFEIGQTVYLKTDEDQRARIIRQMCIRSSNLIQYELLFGTQASWHDEIEIMDEKNILA